MPMIRVRGVSIAVASAEAIKGGARVRRMIPAAHTPQRSLLNHPHMNVERCRHRPERAGEGGQRVAPSGPPVPVGVIL